MNEQFIIENDIIGRYVRGDLSEDEVTEFEAAYFADPKLARMVEIQEALQQHVSATVEARVDVAVAANAPSMPASRWLALAASVALVSALATNLYFSSRLADNAEQIKSLQAALDAQVAGRLITQSIRLAPVRAVTPSAISISGPAPEESLLLELRLPELDPPQSGLTLHITGDGVEQDLASLTPPAGQQTVKVTLPGALLTPGTYELLLRDADDGQVLAAYAFRITL